MTQRTVADRFRYAPETWSESQREFHEATTMEDATHKACCMAGGWYRRPVTIYCQVRGDDEFYQMRPADAPRPDGWDRIYTIDAHKEEL